jgi:hypothetical protein
MTEREKFMSRLAESRSAGLIDMKFFFKSEKPMAPEEIFAALNQFEGASKSPAAVRHTDWIGDEPALVGAAG